MWPFKSKKNQKTEKTETPVRYTWGNPRSGSTANPRRTQLNDADISTTHAQQSAAYTMWATPAYDDSTSRHTSHGHHDSSSSSYDSGSHHSSSSGSDSGSYSSGSDSSSSGSDSGSW